MLQRFIKEGVTILPAKLISQFKDYNVSPQAFLLLIYLVERDQKESILFSLPQIADQFNWSEPLVHQYLNELVTERLIEFKPIKNQEGKQEDSISIDPLYTRLETYYQEKSQDVLANLELDLSQYDLVPTFQKEFKSNLSDLQLLEIVKWKKEDGFSDDVILLALKQAVLSEAVSMRYIDRILLSWKKKGIKTYEQAQAEIERYNQGLDQKDTVPGIVIPKIKW